MTFLIEYSLFKNDTVVRDHCKMKVSNSRSEEDAKYRLQGYLIRIGIEYDTFIAHNCEESASKSDFNSLFGENSVFGDIFGFSKN